MSQLALDLGVPSTLVTEAVYARCLSAMKDARVRASKVLQGPVGQVRRAIAKQFIEADSPGAVRLEDLQLRPGLRAAAGGREGTQLAAELRRHARCCGAAAASSAPRFSIASRKRSTPIRSWKTCCSRRTSAKAVDKAQTAWRHVVDNRRAAGHSGAGVLDGAGLLRRLSAATACRPTCCRPSAITSAPTPTSASTSRARSTRDWLRTAPQTVDGRLLPIFV